MKRNLTVSAHSRLLRDSEIAGKSMYFQLESVDELFEETEEEQCVLVAFEDGASARTAMHHVVPGAGEIDSGFSWHDVEIARLSLSVKWWVLTPFGSVQ